MRQSSPSPARSAPRKSLRNKFIQTLLLVSGTIGIATLVIVSVLTARAEAQHLRAVEQYIEEGIASKGRVLTSNHALALRGLTLDNAFLDMQRLLERAVKDDGDLVFGVYVSAEKETLALARRPLTTVEIAPERDAWKSIGLEEKELNATSGRALRTHRLGQDLLEVAAPVLGETGELLGTLRYGLSTKRMHDALAQAQAESRAQLKRSMLLIGSLVGLTVLLGLIVSRLQAVRITRPIGELTLAAQSLAGGNREVRVNIRSEDELELLGASFNQMVADLDASYRTLEEANRTLEHKVSDRTRELATMNRDMRLVLDNIDQGFVTLSPDGMLAVERSRQVSTWFGEATGPATFWQYLGETSPSFGEAFEIGWSQLVEDFLPVSVCLSQLPERLSRGGRTWSFRYLPFYRADKLEGVLVAIADITERLAREREDAEHFDLMQAFRRLVQDRSSFQVFLAESSEMVATVTGRKLDHDTTLLKRALHTLKGNCSSMGFALVAQLCHTLETELVEQGETSEATLAALATRWGSMADQIASSGGMHSRRMVEVPEKDFAELVQELSDGRTSNADALRTLRAFQGEPVEKRFRQLAERAQELARRTGKGDLRVVVDAGDVRVDGPTFAALFSELIHVVRNAVDHGIESPEARSAQQKSPGGTLTFRAQREGERLSLEISDDGAGIDWHAIEQIAEARGLPHQNQSDLLDALCEDGVTTRSDVTELSGRGVGMAAFRERVLALRGELEVRSVRGQGTSWLVHFPASLAKPSERVSITKGLHRISLRSGVGGGSGPV